MLPQRMPTRGGTPGDNLEGLSRDKVTQGSWRSKEREEGKMQRGCPGPGGGLCVGLKQEWLQPYEESHVQVKSL